MCCYEPTLAEMLADPIVKAVMRADAVEEREIAALFDRVARLRGAPVRRHPPPPARACAPFPP
jgi:hypothetical protein